VRHKKATALLLVMIMALSAFFVLPAEAADIYFTVINDEEPETLSSLTMPFELNGTVYVPYVIFGRKDEFGRSVLGTNAFISNETAVIWKDRMFLEFNTKSNTTYDQDGNAKPYKAVSRKDMIFVPVELVCDFYGLTYSKISSDFGTVIRIKKEYVLEDKIYMNAASGYMQQELTRYLSIQQESQPSQPPQVSGTPYDKRNVEVFISIYGFDRDRVDEMLWKLDLRDYKACFFVTPEDIKQNPNQIQRILGTGHRIGLYLAEDIEKEYLEGAEYLRKAADTRTIITAYNGILSQELRERAEEMGIVFWFDDSCKKYSAEDGFRISSLLNTLRVSEERVDLILKADEEVAKGLDYIVNELAEGNFRVRRVRETETSCIDYSS
jgi:hypothetical protein